MINESINRAEEAKLQQEEEEKERFLVHKKAANIHSKYQKILAETKAELNVYVEMERKEQAESVNRVGVKKGKK